MDTEKEYITITQVAEELGWNKATVYDWIKTLDIKKHRFVRNKNTFLHITDVARLKEIKEKPWTAGPNTARTARNVSENDEKQPALPRTEPTKDEKRPYKSRNTGLPEGCILATEFAVKHGVKRETFRDHMLIGLGPVKEQVDYSERDHPSRKGETERYLTSAQQEAALDFWRRHGVAFTMPETEQEAKEEPAWYLPDQKS